MDTSLFSRAEDFIWKNARLLERRIFAFFFLGGSDREVVSALKAYQNPDGGFGSALEPDKRYPGSTPVDVQTAFDFLDQVGMLEDPAVQAELVLPACDFLTSVTTAEGGVPFTIPEVKRYPCAPWWETGENPPAALNPTAGARSAADQIRRAASLGGASQILLLEGNSRQPDRSVPRPAPDDRLPDACP